MAKAPPQAPSRKAILAIECTAEGIPLKIQYRGILEGTKLRKVHVSAIPFVKIVCTAAELLVKARLDTIKLGKETVGKNGEAEQFRAKVLAKAEGDNCPEWLDTIFNCRDKKNKVLGYSGSSTITWDFKSENSPDAIHIKIGNKTLSSDLAQSGDFRELLSSVFTAGGANYMRDLGLLIVEKATYLREKLRNAKSLDENAFEAAARAVDAISNRDIPVDIHLMSLILPMEFYHISHWDEHHRRISNLTQKESRNVNRRRQRRLHVIDGDTLRDARQVIALADLVLHDLLHGLDSRALVVEREDIDTESGTIPQSSGVLLLDCGIFSSITGDHKVILSDIRPFSSPKDNEFKLFDIPQAEEFQLYSFLRQNFYNAWPCTRKGQKRYVIPAILQEVLKIESEPKDLPTFRFFGEEQKNKGSGPSTLDAIKNRIRRMLSSAKLKQGSANIPEESQFAQWFAANEVPVEE